MKRRTWAAALATAAIAIAAWWGTNDYLVNRREARMRAVSELAAGEQTAADSALSESEIRDRDIEFYERRAAKDTTSASDRSRLAALYMDRARSMGGFTDYQRAERLARQARTNELKPVQKPKAK